MSPSHRHLSRHHVSRRHLLASLAALPVVSSAWHARAQTAGLITGSVCTVLPEASEGPFYIDPDLVRADITEGRPGLPLTLRLQVVDAGCTPIEAARVDVWQCDAGGVYSGVESSTGDARGTTFLRGTQIADAAGVVTFETIYPGWYPGRTPHVHYKVFFDDNRVMTSQVFFPDRVSAQVYASGGAYTRGAADRSNARDGIARRTGEAAIAAMSGALTALKADLVVGLAT